MTTYNPQARQRTPFSPPSPWPPQGVPDHANTPVTVTDAPVPTLSAADVVRLERYQQALLLALHQRDRAALQHTKAQVLHAAYRSAPRPSVGLRHALRTLTWRMSGMLIT